MMFSGNKLTLGAFSLTIAAVSILFWTDSFQADKVELAELPQSKLQSSSNPQKRVDISQSFETLSKGTKSQTPLTNSGETEKNLEQPKPVPAEIVQLNKEIAELVSEYEVGNLTSLDCQLIAEQVTNLHSSSPITRSRGFGICLDCPDYQHMKDKSLSELKKLSDLGDFEALHLYAEKLAQNPNRQLDAVEPYVEAAILGSVTALQRLQTLYTSQRKSIPEEDEDALNFNELMTVSFEQLAKFRQGQPSVADGLPDDPKNVLQWSLRFYKRRIINQRKQRGLPPVENYPIEDIPPVIKKQCVSLMSDAQPR